MAVVKNSGVVSDTTVKSYVNSHDTECSRAETTNYHCNPSTAKMANKNRGPTTRIDDEHNLTAIGV